MKTIAATALLLTGMMSASATAADPHIDELAYAIKRQAAAACREVYYHMRRAPEFQHLYADLYEMYTTADHIHDIAHHTNAICHLRTDVAELDALYHHVEELIEEINCRQAKLHVSYGHYPRGFVPSYRLRRLNSYMKAMECSIHTLQEALGGPVPVPPGVGVPAPPVLNSPVINGPVLRSPQPVSQGRVIRFGKRGSFSVSFSTGR